MRLIKISKLYDFCFKYTFFGVNWKWFASVSRFFSLSRRAFDSHDEAWHFRCWSKSSLLISLFIYPRVDLWCVRNDELSKKPMLKLQSSVSRVEAFKLFPERKISLSIVFQAKAQKQLRNNKNRVFMTFFASRRRVIIRSKLISHRISTCWFK